MSKTLNCESLKVTSSSSDSFNKIRIKRKQSEDYYDIGLKIKEEQRRHESSANESIGMLYASSTHTNHQIENNMSCKKTENLENSLKYEDDSQIIEEVRVSNDSQIIEKGLVSDGEHAEEESNQQTKPKILIQRVFHQLEKHVVEQKLDYVIANSDTEITKHVFGGLFNTKYYPYIPENYCKKHAPNLFEYEDDTLPKIGDKFDTHESFRLYVDGQAKQWKYYLKCADSHRGNGKDTFVYKCVFAKPRSSVTKAKGIRKRTRRVPLHNCPCRVLLKPVPNGATDLTVIYVCNHHDHPLTDDYFYKLQHGRRLHPNVKEELMDLLSLDVDNEIVKKYFELLTGYSMSKGYFANVLVSMKKNKIERQISLEKLREMSKKISRIQIDLGILNEEENEDNPDNEFPPIEKSSKLMEVFKVLNSITTPKKTSTKRRRQHVSETDVDSEQTPARSNKQINKDGAVPMENVFSNSRLETRLQLLKHDQETLENIKHLQESVRTERNPWANDNTLVEIQQRDMSGPKVKRRRNVHRDAHDDVKPVQEPVEESTVDPPAVMIEGSQCDNDIYYGNEVTVEENVDENDTGYIVYENNEPEFLPKELVNIASNDYCIQYEHNDEVNGPCNILEDLEKVPVHIQATELATVNIMPEKDQEYDVDFTVHTQFSNTNAEDEMENNVLNIIGVADDASGYGGALNLEEGNVYEVIETNNKKIFPNRDIVHNVILKKPIIKKSKSKETDATCKPKGRNYKWKSKFQGSAGAQSYQSRNKRIPIQSDNSNSEDFDDILTKAEFVGDLSEYGADLNKLKENEHYIIVVESANEENETTVNNDFTCEEDEVSDWSNLSNISSDVRTQHIVCDELKATISKLHKYKRLLKEDVKKLRDVKNKLMLDIAHAEFIKKAIY